LNAVSIPQNFMQYLQHRLCVDFQPTEMGCLQHSKIQIYQLDLVEQFFCVFIHTNLCRRNNL